ncbi:hypothetical protein U1Q18_052563 [Sarracenia purpurea var. burkii]
MTRLQVAPECSTLGMGPLRRRTVKIPIGFKMGRANGPLDFRRLAMALTRGTGPFPESSITSSSSTRRKTGRGIDSEGRTYDIRVGHKTSVRGNKSSNQSLNEEDTKVSRAMKG